MARQKNHVAVVTVAKPHTLKKFELIENYISEWARKLLNLQVCQGVVFIDCMSNSGLYVDENGNHVEGTPIRAAKLLNTIGSEYPGKKVVVIFNDIEVDRINALQEQLNGGNLAHVKIITSVGDANDFLKQFKLTKYRNFNILLLYDPYIADIDWDAVTPFLNCWGEVIINHMVSDTVRGASQAHRRIKVERYQSTYQKDIDEIISFGTDRQQLENMLMEIIKKQTDGTKNQYYVASFPFFNRTNGVVYNLIYYSKSLEGFKLFKKVAWKTFGGKSSLKNTHGAENQLCLDFSGYGITTTNTDDSCYFVKDIAKYIYDKYCPKGTITLEEIYDDLDRHPIFPSDGYKREIKKELEIYDVTVLKNSIIFR